MNNYQICSNCVMDTSDPSISFDSYGICDHCNQYYNRVEKYKKNNFNIELFKSQIKKIKQSGLNKEYDCILGMSGGLDSSFMLHYAVVELGLRPLVFHVDCGWNSEIASSNIQKMVKKLKLDLFTEVINWEEMREFQLAFFRSGVPHIDLPQDHAYVGTLYKFAKKFKIKYILNGGNISTEGVRNPLKLFYYGTDSIHINDIRQKFCNNPLKNFPFTSILTHKLWLRYLYGIKFVKILDHIDYKREDAIRLLNDKYEWISHGQKHFESRFTTFFEGYWLPKRFGFDTRRIQLSSLILSNQITRQEALKILEQQPLDELRVKEEKIYISNKLNISLLELEKFEEQPLKYYFDYNNSSRLFNLGAKFLHLLGVEKSVKR